MKEIISKLPADKRKLLQEILIRYLDKNPALAMSDREKKKHTKEKIDAYTQKASKRL